MAMARNPHNARGEQREEQRKLLTASTTAVPPVLSVADFVGPRFTGVKTVLKQLSSARGVAAGTKVPSFPSSAPTGCEDAAVDLQDAIKLRRRLRRRARSFRPYNILPRAPWLPPAAEAEERSHGKRTTRTAKAKIVPSRISNEAIRKKLAGEKQHQQVVQLGEGERDAKERAGVGAADGDFSGKLGDEVELAGDLADFRFSRDLDMMQPVNNHNRAGKVEKQKAQERATGSGHEDADLEFTVLRRHRRRAGVRNAELVPPLRQRQLATHVWHAKRFQMEAIFIPAGDEETAWRLPKCSAGVGARCIARKAAGSGFAVTGRREKKLKYRQDVGRDLRGTTPPSTKTGGGCARLVVHDRSYMRVLRIRCESGTSEGVGNLLRHAFDFPNGGLERALAVPKLRTEDAGSAGGCPHQKMGRVDLLRKGASASPASAPILAKDVPFLWQEGEGPARGKHELWLWLHPCVQDAVHDGFLRGALNDPRSSYRIEFLDDAYCFEFFGEGAKSLLRPLSTPPGVVNELEIPFSTASPTRLADGSREVAAAGGPDQDHANAVVDVDLAVGEDGAEDRATSDSELDTRQRALFLNSTVASALPQLPAAKTRHQVKKLISRTLIFRQADVTKVRALWLHFVFAYRAEAIGWEDRHRLLTEHLLHEFPFDFPQTPAGRAWLRHREKAAIEEWMRKPPAKRVNFAEVDARLDAVSRFGGATCSSGAVRSSGGVSSPFYGFWYPPGGAVAEESAGLGAAPAHEEIWRPLELDVDFLRHYNNMKPDKAGVALDKGGGEGKKHRFLKPMMDKNSARRPVEYVSCKLTPVGHGSCAKGAHLYRRSTINATNSTSPCAPASEHEAKLELCGFVVAGCYSHVWGRSVGVGYVDVEHPGGGGVAAAFGGENAKFYVREVTSENFYEVAISPGR